jgi:alpha-galactosidase
MLRNRQPKIVIIGAASSSFSNILQELITCSELDGSQLALVDIDAEGLDIMTRLGQRMCREWERRTTVVGTTERTEVLEGADFVLTLIAAGGVATWRQDEEIPARHGFFGCSVDTVGPGGLFRGLRLIPALIDICRDIERLCPKAWVINYSNPMTAICRALRKVTHVNIVGLCTAGFLPSQIARRMEIDAGRVDVISAGVNHCMWAVKILIDGEDATERWKALIREKQGNDYYRSSVELMDILDVWPMPGANHVAEFFPYFYGPGDDGRDDGRYPYRSGHDFGERLVKDAERRARLKAQGEGTEALGAPPAHESASEAIKMLLSIWNDGRTRHYANVENGGAVPNVSPEAILEIPVIADASGVRALHVGPLPNSVVGFVRSRSAFFELLADAAIHRSKKIALQCLLNDTTTLSIVNARACVDEMFEAQQEFLPGYE